MSGLEKKGHDPRSHFFEKIYRRFNRKEFVHPDPLEFVLRFREPADQEVAGLIASGMAYGRVGQILNSLEKVFTVLARPSADMERMTRRDMLDSLGSFRHRWTTGHELVDLLRGITLLREEYGSLEKCFMEGAGDADGSEDVIPALDSFVTKLRLASGRKTSSLLASPSLGSACKRMFLFLRWMVRRDEVDPGPWTGVLADRLIVPLDVHMHRLSLRLGLTSRRQADLKCAVEVTRFFRRLVPEDPVRYDFALTRLGIRPPSDPVMIPDELSAERAHFC